MKVVERFILSKFYRIAFFPDAWKIPITKDELEALKLDIILRIQALENATKTSEKIKLDIFWSAVLEFYTALLKMIQKSNRKYWFSYDASLKNSQRIFFNRNLPDLKPIQEHEFQSVKNLIVHLIRSEEERDRQIQIDFFYDFSSFALTSDIGIKENGDVTIVLNDGVMELYQKDREKFIALFNHEVAHMKQKDTRHFYRKIFFEEGYFKKSFLLRGSLFSILFLLFVGLMMSQSSYFGFDDFLGVAGKRGLAFLFSFFIVMRAIRWKRNRQKKAGNRYYSELGADTFSMAKGKSLKILELLEEGINPDGDYDTDTHLSPSNRLDQLKGLLAYCFKVMEHRYGERKSALRIVE